MRTRWEASILPEDYVVSYLTPEEVIVVAQAIQKIEKPWFRKRYFGLRKKILWFDLTQYDGPICENDFEYSWSYFEEIRAFYAKAATAKRAVIFTVDQ